MDHNHPMIGRQHSEGPAKCHHSPWSSPGRGKLGKLREATNWNWNIALMYENLMSHGWSLLMTGKYSFVVVLQLEFMVSSDSLHSISLNLSISLRRHLLEFFRLLEDPKSFYSKSLSNQHPVIRGKAMFWTYTKGKLIKQMMSIKTTTSWECPCISINGSGVPQ